MNNEQIENVIKNELIQFSDYELDMVSNNKLSVYDILRKFLLSKSVNEFKIRITIHSIRPKMMMWYSRLCHLCVYFLSSCGWRTQISSFTLTYHDRIVHGAFPQQLICAEFSISYSLSMRALQSNKLHNAF